MKLTTSVYEVLLVSAVMTGPVAMWAQAPAPGSGSVSIGGPVRVIEGDTLEVNIQGRRVGVGIVGIVAPAGNTDCGRDAISFVYDIVSEGVELEEDPGVPAFDAANRRMYRVVGLRDKTSIALALATAGLARADPRAQMALEHAEIAAAEAAARQNRRGCIR